MMLFAPLLLLAAAPVTEPPAIALFRSVCINGGMTLKRADFVEVAYQDIPREAREALAESRIEIGNGSFGDPAPRAREVPNRIYRMSALDETYLVLPTGDKQSKRAYAGICAVIVKADALADAKVLFPAGARSRTLTVGSTGGEVAVPYRSAPSGAFLLVTARSGDWTIMSSLPDARRRSSRGR